MVWNTIFALPWAEKKEDLVSWGDKLQSQGISPFSELKQDKNMARDDEDASSLDLREEGTSMLGH